MWTLSRLWHPEPTRQRLSGCQPLDKFARTLDALQDRTHGSKTVAVITMTGSCCPVTKAHCMAFDEARELLLGENEYKPAEAETYGEVLGLLSLNGDKHVGEKLRSKGELAISHRDRSKLVNLATAEKNWMCFNPWREHEAVEYLQKTWPRLKFIRYEMNGADDVCKYQKWRHCDENRRCIVMGRPGFTEQVIQGAEGHGIPLDQGYFIIGRELPDISSTAVRRALQGAHGHPPRAEDLQEVLHPSVAEWLLKPKIYEKHSRFDCSFGSLHGPFRQFYDAFSSWICQ